MAKALRPSHISGTPCRRRVQWQRLSFAREWSDRGRLTKLMEANGMFSSLERSNGRGLRGVVAVTSADYGAIVIFLTEGVNAHPLKQIEQRPRSRFPQRGLASRTRHMKR
jgi:hypothetical protein